MKMIEEAYVSLEVAKMLYEKGFNQRTCLLYDENGDVMLYGVYDKLGRTYNSIYPMPTQQMVMRWLREEYKIDITVDPHNVCDMWIYQYHLCKNKKYLFSKDVDESYEICAEEAIKYCLENLI